MSRAHVYRRDHINTDEIIPARYLNTDDQAELAKHCLEDLDPDFVSKAKKGDIIVAGEDFGCGSSREHAVWAIRGAKVQTVIAKSFARIFYRSAFNIGLPILECQAAVDGIEDGQELEVDLVRGEIKNRATGQSFNAAPIPEFMQEIIDDGGLMAHIAKKKLKT